jgi:hypothetical protein
MTDSVQSDAAGINIATAFQIGVSDTQSQP